MGNFNMLPSEIMLEILSRVPAEYVVDCKCVSKPWRNLFQYPSLLQLHLNHLNGPGPAHESIKSSFIFYTVGEVQNQFHYTEYDDNLNRFSGTTRIDLRLPCENSYLVGADNGLICFNKPDIEEQPAYICNPITRECIFLPKAEGIYVLSGFGYTPSTNEYKAVRICISREVLDLIVHVYTLGSGVGWRNVRKYIDYEMVTCWQCTVSADGAIYWLDDEQTVIAFDLANEEIHKIPPLPFSPQDGCNLSLELHVLGDFLCAYYHYNGSWELWSLKKGKNYQDAIWSKEFNDFSDTRIELITLTKSGGLLCYDYGDNNVYLYAAKASSSRMLVNFGVNFDFVVPHKNTLVSLKALGEEETKQMNSCERARSSEETEINDY